LDCLADLLDRHNEQIFDDAAWRVLTDRAVITREQEMIMYFIDGSKYVYQLPKYSPIRRKNALK